MKEEKELVVSENDAKIRVSCGEAAEAPAPEDTKKHIAGKDKKIYFTFDDGPSETTELLLDILKKHHVKASFFVTNREQRPDLLKKIAEDGHTICLHSYTHRYEEIYSSPEAYFDDLRKIDELVYETVGIRSKIVRLPGGTFNTVHRQFCEGIIPIILSGLTERGYRVIDWDCDNNDGVLFHLPPEAYLAYFLDQAAERKEIVFLSHNRPGDEESVRSIDMILDFCEKNGWETDTVENYSGPAPVGFKEPGEHEKKKSRRSGSPYLTLVNAQSMMDGSKTGKLSLVLYEDIEGIPVRIERNTLIAFLKMKYFLAQRGIIVGIRSAFRTVGEQKAFWDKGMAQSDFDFNTFGKRVALPWASEHHTGLAIDIALKEGDGWPEFFSDPKAEREMFSVIRHVCPRFGFILRYPEGKESITGYQYEPWHLRYVGIRHAKAMYKGGLTLEEYKAELQKQPGE